MKILFLGYAISREEASKVYGASIAGNKMQINVLEQLTKYENIELNCITVYPTAAYPKGKLLIRRKSIVLFDNFLSTKIGFVNLPMIKQFCETISTYFQAKKIVKREEIHIVFTFNMFPQIGLPAKWLKKKYGCEIVSLLADLPIDDTVGRKIISKALRKCFDRLTEIGIASSDKIIALNKYAIELYMLNTPYIVMEGGVDTCDIRDLPVKDYSSKNIIYSGALVEYSGIINLIEAMKFVKDKKVRLDIYGKGQIERYVSQCAEEMSSVRYHGEVDNDTMIKIQGEAYLLVNPRPVDNPIAKVTFPSKLFEYMISGTPVLTTKLNGLSEDYLEYLFVAENNEPHQLAEKINEIMSLPKSMIKEKALLAREFMIANKTWEKQGQRIYEFIKEGYEDFN